MMVSPDYPSSDRGKEALIVNDAKNVPLINSNPSLKAYYGSLESRIGYRLLLGGARHFGYYERDTYWPFPFSSALDGMVDRLGDALSLPDGSKVLDAGCGDGLVALRLAKTRSFQIEGIDVTDHHLARAKHNISRSGIRGSASTAVDGVESDHCTGSINLRKMDYHHLETLADASFDGLYTCETFVHATDPEAVLAGFYRVLKPGGRLAMHEYSHSVPTDRGLTGLEGYASGITRQILHHAALPAHRLYRPGAYREMLEEAGFVDVVVRDYTDNLRPMLRFFFVLGFVPFLVAYLLGLERHVVNAMTGVHMFLGIDRDTWHYVALSARKPDEDDGRRRPGPDAVSP